MQGHRLHSGSSGDGLPTGGRVVWFEDASNVRLGRRVHRGRLAGRRHARERRRIHRCKAALRSKEESGLTARRASRSWVWLCENGEVQAALAAPSGPVERGEERASCEMAGGRHEEEAATTIQAAAWALAAPEGCGQAPGTRIDLEERNQNDSGLSGLGGVNLGARGERQVRTAKLLARLRIHGFARLGLLRRHGPLECSQKYIL